MFAKAPVSKSSSTKNKPKRAPEVPQKKMKTAVKEKNRTTHLLGNTQLNLNKCGSKKVIVGLGMEDNQPRVQLSGVAKILEFECEDYWQLINKLEARYNMEYNVPIEVGKYYKIIRTSGRIDNVQMDLFEILDQQISLKFVENTIDNFMRMQHLISLKLNHLTGLEFDMFMEAVQEAVGEDTNPDSIRQAAERVIDTQDPLYYIFLEEKLFFNA